MSAQGATRLSMPDRELLSQAQVRAIEQITSGPRGALVGPFVPLLRSPELMTRLQLVGEYLRYGSVLDDALFELAVLAVARRWDQQFEWGHHQPLAVQRGVPRSVIEDVEAGRRPQHERAELAQVWDVVHGLLDQGGIDDEVYDAALALLGEQALIELIVTVGYYTTLALTMNAARTPSPDDAPRMAPATSPARTGS